MNEPKRLTPEVFQELLDAHPDFHLMAGCWGKGPCGGCAMTLAYYHANPTTPLLVDIEVNPVCKWANTEYGEGYVDEFISTFDGDRLTDEETDDTNGAVDGFACMRLAYSMGRLE